MSKYFSVSYMQARSRFIKQATAIGAALHSHDLDTPGANGEVLTIDFAVLRRPDDDSPLRRVLVHTSGVHGVEGFAGSAVQIDALVWFGEHLANNPMPPGVCVVIVHVLNPYGMSWLRRWNENNVDLNRNFLDEDGFREFQSKGTNPVYEKLYSFINPPTPSNALVGLKAKGYLLRYGVKTIKQSLAGGQYTHPEGLFFGGAELQSGPKALVEFLTSIGVHKDSGVEEVVHVDVHTGLGKGGHDTVICMSPQDVDYVQEIFGTLGNINGTWHVELANPTASVSYLVGGNINDGLRNFLSPPNCKWSSYAQEFGTFPGTTVFKALRAEGAAWRLNRQTPITREYKLEVRRVFYPPDKIWENTVLERGRDALQQTYLIMTGERQPPKKA